VYKIKKILGYVKAGPRGVRKFFRRLLAPIRRLRWWLRWPIYLVIAAIVALSLSWLVDQFIPEVSDPAYGVSFSEPYAKQLGSDWQANYIALLKDLGFKKLRLMTYWEDIEPTPGHYDFTDLDWQIAEAKADGAHISLAMGYRQPRWPECHEPDWAAAMPVESSQWKSALYSYMTTVVNRYKTDPTVISYQLENEAENSLFGGCRGGVAPKSRLTYEFNMVKRLDPTRPTYMSLSDEHGFPFGQPTPDGYGFSIYRVVYSTTFPIHFYLTYPITDWYHRLRMLAIIHIKHRPVFIHELQLEPWGPKDTQDLTVAEQNRSMSTQQMQKSLEFARKTGIQTEYLWGGEWWYWRLTHFHDPGPWNVVKHALQTSGNASS